MQSSPRDDMVRLAARGRLVLVADRLVDGTGRPALEAAFVAIEGERIAAVGSGSRAEGRLPESVKRLDFPGCTILPGLVDSHVHLTFSAGPVPLHDLLEPGKIADLVIVRGDPTRDIRDIRHVEHVFHGGRVAASAGQLVDDRRPLPRPLEEIAERRSLWDRLG